MEIYSQMSFSSILTNFFWFSNMILSDSLNLQTQQVITSQIRSRIKYLIWTYYILVLIF